jgi:hypothetical protein
MLDPGILLSLFFWPFRYALSPPLSLDVLPDQAPHPVLVLPVDVTEFAFSSARAIRMAAHFSPR